MAKWKCNSCGTVYSDTGADGATYYHACHPDVIEHATFDKDGQQLTPEKRTPRQNIRDENYAPGVFMLDGKWYKGVPDPETPGRLLHKPAELAIISEGLGRTLVE